MTKPKTLEQLRADKERDRDAACTGTAQVGASGKQKEVSGTGRTGRNFDRNGKDHAAQRGRDAFGSTPDQAPKEAKYAVLIPGPGMFVNVRNGPRVVIPPPPRTFRKYCAQSEKTATSPSCKQITQPSGAATPRNSDTHERIAVPRLSAFFGSTPQPRPKSGKVCRSTPWPRRVSETCGTVRG